MIAGASRRWDPRFGAAVAVLLAVALLARLWGIRSGLPWVYNVDEGDHFVIRAGQMLGGNLRPTYTGNPPAFTYLLAGIYELWYGGQSAFEHVYRSADPTEVWVIARVCSALLGTLAVWLLYLAGRRLFDGWTGLLAAATMAVAFLPVFYGKLALNDVPALVGVCLSLWGSAGVLRRGHRRDYVIAGLGLGIAAATKYTGGAVVLALIAAALVQLAGGGAGRRRAALWTPIAGVLALAAFVALDPYSLIDWHAFAQGISHQSSESVGAGKLGASHGSGIVYYLWSLTWGVGWVPAVLAAVGALVIVQFDRPAAAMLIPLGAAYLIFMGAQSRWFGRWAMPIIPVVCLLGAYVCTAAARALGRGRPVVRATVLGAAAVALCAQGTIDSIHSGIVNARTDTRGLALAYLASQFRPRARVVIEPIAPARWGGRFQRFPALLSHHDRRGRLRIYAGKPVSLEDYERTLSPALIGLYESGDYCVVVTGSTEEGRAYANATEVPDAIAYYRALARQGTLIFRASPYSLGSAPVAFNFDWSFDYYPVAYVRPGPTVSIYELHGGRCGFQPPPLLARRPAGR